ncbi:GntR family transcriptional regulator [Paracerasibacillus soli]|uniref:GntR family transcriptional regulator n=1 Tax=Paracerasibacillus soli TaxID=480284 RepID=A0ABU5CV82_9BACI|nr:GntR family transcriptional regulator [Virgibacillus soli]MDY0410293.1 GntR family transcriptional regulator [Virgibacillus soli]
MKLDVDSIKPIYIQIAEWIENKILEGTFQQDEKVFSQYQLAEKFNINPATAAKGLHMLSEEDILYTKRGLGKFVKEGARSGFEINELMKR